MKYILTIICVFLTLTTYSQGSGIYLTRDTLARTVLNLKKDTTFWVNGRPIQTSISGTGMFVRTNSGLYIVTAGHVAKSMDFQSYVISRETSDMPRKILMADLINTASPRWMYHKKADLAVLKLSPKPNLLASSIFDRYLPIACVNRDSISTISRDLQLTVIGFPLQLGTNGRFSPLTYRTYASSGYITYARADTKTPCEFIILENPSVGGYSGGPVFDVSIVTINAMTTTGNGTMCYGFIHGTLSDDTGGKMAAVTPSYFLYDLIK